MAIPASIEARLFYRCAFERYEDAEVLLRAEHTTGGVYMAGYGVECILKALVLSALAPAARSEMLKSFRGTKVQRFRMVADAIPRERWPSLFAGNRGGFRSRQYLVHRHEVLAREAEDERSRGLLGCG